MVNIKRARKAVGAMRERRARSMLTVAASHPAFHLESHVFFLFTQIFGRRNRQLTEALKPLAISIPQWRVLAVLHERPGLTMNQLADLATVDRTTLTRALDAMVRRRLVERRADTRDRRSVRLHLTETGNAAFFQVLPRVVEQNERAMAGFTEAEGAVLRSMLHRMFDNLGNESVAAGGQRRRGT
jgi:DNA-binding MarR family transcriptional regulator